MNIWHCIGKNNEGNLTWQRNYPNSVHGEVEMIGKAYYPTISNTDTGNAEARHGFSDLLSAFDWCDKEAPKLETVPSLVGVTA